MCGIAGIFGSSDQATVERMLNAMIHRGPDDGHQVSGQGFTLGARRLSIMDLADGRQPMCNETGKIWAAQNGELYNFPHIRAKLVDAGHKLKTHCDTEVLPHLYEDYGVKLPEQIDGMFAVAVWDEQRQSGLLVRDRMGKKPLYYTHQGDKLYFASEIKCLLQIPSLRRKLNLEALHHYLSYKHVPHPLSIFEGIYMLPPAHALTFAPETGLTLHRYWQLPMDSDPDLIDASEEELVEQLLDHLKAGVERRLMADVPIGFFLSGGLDSSLSTAIAAEMCPGRIKTFTLTYGPESTTKGKDDDQRWARWVADKYKTEHLEERIEFTDFPDSFRKIIQSFDEPFSGVVSTYFLSKLISQHVKVALAGDGADELFGSYLTHRLAYPMAHLSEYEQTKDSTLIKPFEQQLDFLQRLKSSKDWQWRSKLFVFDESEKLDLYHPDIAETMKLYSTPGQLYLGGFASLRETDPLNRILKAEFQTVFPDQVLAFVDRLSMAHSLEVRSAFLDTEYVNFVARLPGQWKIRQAENKYLLKKAALRYFPHEMAFRPKEGFVMPINTWLMQNLKDYVQDTLSPSRLQQHGLFQPEKVQSTLEQFYAGETRFANRILSLLAFQEWHDLYKPEVLTPALRRVG